VVCFTAKMETSSPLVLTPANPCFAKCGGRILIKRCFTFGRPELKF